MRIENLQGYVFYATPDRTRVDAVMDGDNDGHGKAWEAGMTQVDQVEYWAILIEKERRETMFKKIDEAIRIAAVDDYAVVF